MLGSHYVTIYYAEPEIKFDGPADVDNNYVENPDQISEPKRRKMSLRASVIGQPGILAGPCMCFCSYGDNYTVTSIEQVYCLLLLRDCHSLF